MATGNSKIVATRTGRVVVIVVSSLSQFILNFFLVLTITGPNCDHSHPHDKTEPNRDMASEGAKCDA